MATETVDQTKATAEQTANDTVETATTKVNETKDIANQKVADTVRTATTTVNDTKDLADHKVADTLETWRPRLRLRRSSRRPPWCAHRPGG